MVVVFVVAFTFSLSSPLSLLWSGESFYKDIRVIWSWSWIPVLDIHRGWADYKKLVQSHVVHVDPWMWMYVHGSWVVMNGTGGGWILWIFSLFYVLCVFWRKCTQVCAIWELCPLF